MLISQSPTRLACYARLISTAWMLIEFTREHFEKRNSIERKTPYNIIRNSQLWLVGWCFGQIRVSSIYRHLRNSMEPWLVHYNSRIQECSRLLNLCTRYFQDFSIIFKVTLSASQVFHTSIEECGLLLGFLEVSKLL